MSIFDLMPCSDWLKSTSRHLSNLIDLLASFAHTFSNMAIEAGRDFEFVLRELLCELEKKGLNFSLKEEQKTAVKELFEGRDVVAVLPTGFGKSLIFQLLVLLARRAKNQAACVLVICPLTSIINDQIQEVEAMGLCACNLSEKLSDLTDIEQGKFAIVYSSAEIAIDKRFLESLKKDSPFSRFIAACVVDESHTIETWTGLRYVFWDFYFL